MGDSFWWAALGPAREPAPHQFLFASAPPASHPETWVVQRSMKDR